MEQIHAEPNYMKVFWWLLALTIVEVGIVYMKIPKAAMVSGLVLLALAKAFLVAWYFMHLRNEKIALVAMVGLPLLLLVDLFLGLMPDVARRLF